MFIPPATQRQALVVCCSSHSPLASGARVLFPTTSSILLDHVFAPNIRKVRSRAIPYDGAALRFQSYNGWWMVRR